MPNPAVPIAPSFLNRVLSNMRVTTLLCSRQKHEHGYSMNRRIIRDWNFIYVIRGKPVWIIEDVEYPLEPQELILVPPGIPHHATCRTQTVTLGSLHVLAVMPNGQDVFQLLGPPHRQTMIAGSRFYLYFRAFMDEFDRPSDEHKPMFPGWAHLITRELFRDNAARELLQPRPADPMVVEVLALIDGKLNTPLTLDYLAAHSGYSPQHLNRIFKRVLGTTPMKYLAATRLDRAAELLLSHHGLSITEVAKRVGHLDPTYFTRQFHQRFALTPSEYRTAACSESPSPSSFIAPTK